MPPKKKTPTTAQHMTALRRVMVEKMLVRGVTQQEMAIELVDENVLNPQTNQPYCHGTINADCQLIEKRWLGGEDIAAQRAMAIAEIDAAKRMAFKDEDAKTILQANKSRRELFGIDAAKKQENLNIDLNALPDEYLDRIAAGEPPATVYAEFVQSVTAFMKKEKEKEK